MIKWMDDCVYEVPETCASIIDSMDSLINPLVEQFTKKKYSKILFVGSGSSYNIAMCSKHGIRNLLGIDVGVLASATYTYLESQQKSDVFIIFLSQGGRSTNTVDGINAAKENKSDFAVLTMAPDTPISDITKNHYIYGSHHKGADVFVSRGLPTSIMYLQLFAIKSALKLKMINDVKYNELIKNLKSEIDGLKTVYDEFELFYKNNIEEFHTMDRVMLVGIGEGYGLALEGALKITETIGLAANGYELEEFLHGPVYSVKKDHTIFIIDINEQLHERTLQVFNNLKELTDKVYLITKFKTKKDKRIFYINVGEFDAFSPIKFVAPFQLISSKVCQDLRVRAITINTHRFMQNVKTKL